MLDSFLEDREDGNAPMLPDFSQDTVQKDYSYTGGGMKKRSKTQQKVKNAEDSEDVLMSTEQDNLSAKSDSSSAASS